MIITIPERLRKAENIEQILCVATLFAYGEIETIPGVTLLEQSKAWFESHDESCETCPLVKKCLACEEWA